MYAVVPPDIRPAARGAILATRPTVIVGMRLAEVRPPTVTAGRHRYGSETREHSGTTRCSGQPAQKTTSVHAGFRQANARVRNQLVHGYTSIITTHCNIDATLVRNQVPLRVRSSHYIGNRYVLSFFGKLPAVASVASSSPSTCTSFTTPLPAMTHLPFGQTKHKSCTTKTDFSEYFGLDACSLADSHVRWFS